MKQIIYNWAVLCLILITATNLTAQTRIECNRDFVIKTKVTESTCMANGTIEVTMEGDLSEIEVSMTEYALRPMEGTEGTSLQFSRDNVLRSVAAGKYVVSLRTFCVAKGDVGVVTESSNVVVGGTYKPLMVELDLSRARTSYPDCATGLIAFNLKSDTGYGNLTYHLSKAPAGVALGEVFPTKGATSSGYVQYTLPDFYPSGEYQMEVYDSCSKATVQFTLGQTVGFPNPTGTPYPKGFGQSCNVVKLNNTNPVDNGNNHYQRYFSAGLYELAVVPKGQTPSDSDWQVWKGSTDYFTLPGSYKDYFTSSSLDIHIRLKGCDKHFSSYNGTLKAATLYGGSAIYNCDYYQFTATIYNNDSDGFWCYPIKVEAIDNATGVVAYEKTYTADDVKTSYSFSPFRDFPAEYGISYTFKVTDASSYSHQRLINYSFLPDVSFYTYYESYFCDTFKSTVRIGSNYSCYPVNLVVYKENSTGDFEVYDTKILTSYDTTVEYPYGRYILEATFPGHITQAGTPYVYKSVIYDKTSPKPTTITLTSNTSTYYFADLSNEYYGYLQIQGNATFSAGTRFTVTDAPAGYRHKGRTFTYTSTTNTNYFYLGNSDTGSNSTAIYMPEGDYSITVEDDCGTNLSATAYLKTGFDAKDVKYIIEEDGCNGGRIKLDTQNGGFVKLKGNSSSSYTNFTIISGPVGGYERGLKKYNQDLQIVADGEYVIGTVISSSYPNYFIRKDTINFEKSKPTLKASVTSAYVCTDPGSTLGYMIFTGQGGKAPYAYELLDADENPTGLTATGGVDERVVFNYGVAGESYVVRITDACGNSTTQGMTLADLKTQSIIYNIPATGEYCTGDTLKLNCVTLGQTTYLWEKKISEGVYEFVSNAQNPRISPVTEANSGVYRVTVTPEYCGEAITGELTVKVYPQLAAGAVSADQEICVGTRASEMSCALTGGKGVYNYQWQVSTDQIAWSDASNGNTRTYSALHTSSGAYYYRLQTMDECATVTSDIITLNVKPCYIMVNPNIRSVAR